MALTRRYRLSKKDVERVFKRGKTVQNSFFFIRFLRNELSHIRVAVIVPSRVFKRAVDRNHLKRIISGTIQSGHFLERSLDIAISATVNIVGKPTKEIKREIEQTINKFFSQMK